MSATETVAKLLLEFVIPGVGGTIFDAIVRLKALCADMRSFEPKCREVVEQIEDFYGVLQGIQGAKQLESNLVIPNLAKTITDFQTVMKEHSKKHTLARLFTHGEVDEKIRSFHSRIDHLLKLLDLTHIAESDGWRKKSRGLQERDHDLLLEIQSTNANMYALMNEYKGENNRREAMMLMQFGIAEKSKSRKFSKDEVTFMKKTRDAIAERSMFPIEELPPWYLPSEDVACPDEAFDEGTYGVVYRGTWNGTPVVIKRLLMTGDQVEKSFFREVKVWSTMNHPRVVKLWGACHVSSPLFFVCEDAPNGNFAEFFKVKENKQQLWRRFHEAALGLAYLHSEKVVHGDLKCTNLLIAADGRTKICDFGFSYIRNASMSLSEKAKTDAVRWTALECFETQERPPPESDVYSLALCIIEAVSGELPWGDMKDEVIVGKLYDGEGHKRPDGLTDEQWSVVRGMADINMANRTPLMKAVTQLGELASEEEEQWRAAAVDVECPECHYKSSGAARFCSHCAHAFA